MPVLTKNSGRLELAAAWIIAILMAAVLGWLRLTTKAEYAFASALVIPVFLVTWTGGLINGLIASVLAAVAWICSDSLLSPGPDERWLIAINGLTRLGVYVFVAYLTSRVRSLLLREIELSTRDALTGLLNRRAFFEAGEAEAGRAARYARPLAVVFLDLDNFKQLNDSRGHKAGDQALQAVAAALRKSLRSTDSIARLGGDEFAILMPEIDEAAAGVAGRKIAGAISSALADFSPVSASIGIAWFAHPTAGIAAIVQAADSLMYQVKRNAKGGVRLEACSRTIGRDPPQGE